VSTTSVTIGLKLTIPATTRNCKSRTDDPSGRDNTLGADSLASENFFNSLYRKFSLAERRRDELKRTIEELQDEMDSLEMSATETADYAGERLQEARKKRRCVHKDIEEPIGLEVRIFVGHDRVSSWRCI